MIGLTGKLAAKVSIVGALSETSVDMTLGFSKTGSSQHIRALIDGIPHIADAGAIIRELFGFSRDKIGISQMSVLVVGTPDLRKLA